MSRVANWFEQILGVTWYNLRSIPRRWTSSLATVLGVAGVVLVFVGVLSMAEGFEATLATTGTPANVLVLRAGSDGELSSLVSLETTRIVEEAPEIARGVNGDRLASSELFVIVDIDRKSSGTPANVPLRGVEPVAPEIRRSFDILEGRMFESGRREVIAGRAAANQFVGLEVGNRLRWGENEWTVVGIFSTDGTVEDSEVWTDARVLQPAYRRGDSFQSVHLRLADPDRFDALKERLEADPRLDVKVLRETEFYADQSRALVFLIKGIGSLISLLMACGAIFGAVNTLYTSVASRRAEIATLRAIGFGALPILVSVMAEAAVLSGLGGLLGATGAWLLFHGVETATLNFQTFSQVAFGFAVTPELMLQGLVLGSGIGLIGGLLPAVRAVRSPLATALRS